MICFKHTKEKTVESWLLNKAWQTAKLGEEMKSGDLLQEKTERLKKHNKDGAVLLNN